MSRAKQKFQRESPIKAIQIVTDKKEVGTITLGDLTSSELKLVSQKPNANYFLGYFDYGKSYGLSISLYTGMYRSVCSDRFDIRSSVDPV